MLMQKLLLMVVAAMMAISASAQGTVKKVYVYQGDTVAGVFYYGFVDSIVMVDVVPSKAFSVADGKQVYFSPGNLQYQASTDTWRFAEHQYDIIGADNTNASDTYTGWIDLFGWGTSGYDNTANDPYAIYYQPWSTSTRNDVSNEYNVYGYGPSTNQADGDLIGANANYDWGVYNAISNGGNVAGQWRTLTETEWKYVSLDRPNAMSLCGLATVCGIKGYVLWPDEANPADLGFTVIPTDYTTNTINASTWEVMEAMGAIFFPAAGLRDGTEVTECNVNGYYWTASSESGSFSQPRWAPYVTYPDPDMHYRMDSYSSYRVRCSGFSVRLVKDVQ